MGSSSNNPNGRGRIFQDGTFEYMPIPEVAETARKVPTYRDLGFASVKFPDLPVHFDPEFETFTYGHVRRGFGDTSSLVRLREDKKGILFFYATLQKDENWAPYLIGYFKELQIHDCRGKSKKEILKLENSGFSNNAHLKRLDPSVDFLIKGGEDSRMLKRAFKLAEGLGNERIAKKLKKIVLTASGKKVKSGTHWYRWTLICHEAERLFDLIRRDRLI